MNHLLNRLDEPSRRRFMKSIAKSFLGVSLMSQERLTAALSQASTAQKVSAKRVIYLFMSGGMSHIDTFDPKPDNKEVQGPVGVIGTNVDGIRLTSNLPKVAKQMDKIALIRNMSHTQGNHEPGQYVFRTGYEQQAGIIHPALGAWTTALSQRNNPNLPPYVRLGGLGGHPASGFMEARYAPLPISNPNSGLNNSTRPEGLSEDRFTDGLALSRALDDAYISRYSSKDVRAYGDYYNDAVTMMSSSDLDAFDLKKEPQEIQDAYGKNPFGRGTLLARRLVERGVNFIEVDLGGWDTHVDNHVGVADKCLILDQVLSTLLQDLSSKGMLEDTLVVMGTEFGRQAKIDGFKGRNHYPIAYTCLMAGGGVRGGQVIGETSGDGMEIIGDKVGVLDFNATIAYALGLDTTKLFEPFKGAQKFSIVGKDTDPNKGKPIPGLLG